jgi:hypothetical protein
MIHAGSQRYHPRYPASRTLYRVRPAFLHLGGARPDDLQAFRHSLGLRALHEWPVDISFDIKLKGANLRPMHEALRICSVGEGGQKSIRDQPARP